MDGSGPWSFTKAPPSQSLDCVDLLSRTAPAAAVAGQSATTPLPSVLPLLGLPLREFDCMDLLTASQDATEAICGSIIAEVDPPSPSPSVSTTLLSATAPEFVPLGAQAKEKPPQKSQSMGRLQHEVTTAATAMAPAPAAARGGGGGRGGNPAATSALAAPLPLGEREQRTPLCELTNVVAEVGDLLRPFKPPSAGSRVALGTLSSMCTTPSAALGPLCAAKRIFHDDDFLDAIHEDSDASGSLSPAPLAGGAGAGGAAASSSEEGASVAGSWDDARADGIAGNTEIISDSGDDGTVCQVLKLDLTTTLLDEALLPSIGSAQHATGECKRCNFFPKGRCQNGKNCTFCHFPHDKRKPSRQEKRERRAAWLSQQEDRQPPQEGEEECEEKDQEDEASPKGAPATAQGQQEAQRETYKLAAQVVQKAQQKQALHDTAPRGAQHVVRAMHEQALYNNTSQVQGLAQLPPQLPEFLQPRLGFPSEDIYSEEVQQTIAYSVFPGLPPFRATKLPAPLALPGTGDLSTATTCPLLPPGLPPPQHSWQPDEEISPAAHLLGLQAVSTHAALAGVAGDRSPLAGATMVEAMPTSSPHSTGLLATSAPQMPSVVARTTCTVGTQTAEDFVCPLCGDGDEEDNCADGSRKNEESIKGDENSQAKDASEEPMMSTMAGARVGRLRHGGRRWSREELLRLRGNPEKGSTPTGPNSLTTAPFRTVAIPSAAPR